MLACRHLLDKTLRFPEMDMLANLLQHSAVPVLRDAADAFVEVGCNDVVLEWNAHAAALFGWTAQEAKGRKLASLLLPPTHRSAWQNGLQQCLAPRSRYTVRKRIELTALHADGKEIPAEFTITLMHLTESIHFAVSIRDLSRLRDTEHALNERTALLNLCREAIVIADMEDRILFWNAGAEQMFGYLAEEAVGHRWHDLVPDVPDGAREEIGRELQARGNWEGKRLQIRRDGSSLHTLCRMLVERDERGDPQRLLITSTDIGTPKRIADATASQENEQRFHSLFEHHTDGVFSFNSLSQLTAANPALCRLTGYGHDELLAMKLSDLVAPQCGDDVRMRVLDAMRGKPQACDVQCVKKDGTRVEIDIILLPDIVEGHVFGLRGIVKDISHRKQNERRIEYLANHDALTGLPNRNLLGERMGHAIEQAKRLGTRIGVLFMDLNRFKVINDSLGHEVGDMLLCTLAGRLKSTVREGDTVARLGGDEFVVLLENIHEYEQIARIADTLLKVVCRPVELSGQVVAVSTSIGASIFPSDGQDAITLFKNADLAMYEAKASGPGLFRLYDAGMNAKAVERLHRENSLRLAMERGEFVVHYQPRLDIIRNAIVSVEALVRWNHPDKGLIFPASFIPLAEEIGLIDTVGEWVLQSACRQLKAWQEDQLPPLRMSVNLSAVQLGSGRIRDVIRDVLADTALDAHFLELELTESSLMQDLDACARTLNDIRQLGVTLSIDDFGTGYSSLGYLKRLPIDTLKIDKSFVGDIARDSDDTAIVSATIAMAHRMNLRVVAEGVTSHEQMRFLESCQCDEIQGYLLCQPLPPDEMADFFRTSELRGISRIAAV
ncbi:bifunctional diguanylate cyclase/phosphodiesterase [Herbaspirillum sp. HC18]|nr:bifunctional diguanylate cyclase/phosphodiesterase [Herbaspirillum sp. HC18]